MRWHDKPKKKPPEDGTTRVVRRFLFFPLCLKSEYRWLEFVKIKQRYWAHETYWYKNSFGGESLGSRGGYWSDVDFV